MNTEQTKSVWIVITIIALVLGAYYFGSISKKSTESTQNTKTDSVLQTDTDQRSTDQKWQDLGYQVIQVGSDKVTSNDITFSLNNIQNLGQEILKGSLSIPDCCDYDKTTAGKFMRVDLEINNIGINGKSVNILFPNLIDQTGRSYQSSSHGFKFADTQNNLPGYLAPNIPTVLSILYEVSQDSNNFTLKFYYK